MSSGPSHTMDRAFLAATLQGSHASELGFITTPGQANDLLATIPAPESESCWLVLVPAMHADAANAVAEMSSILAQKCSSTGGRQLALVANPAPNADAMSGLREMMVWLRRSLPSGKQKQPAGVVVTVRAAAVLDVGGFTTSTGGLGLADLATRLRRGSWTVDGASTDPVSLQDLEPQLSVRERLRSAADWHRQHGNGKSFDRYQRLVRRAATVEATLRRLQPRSRSRPSAVMVGQILSDARSGWPRARPDEDQYGVGQRADWRFLLPHGPVRHLLLTGSAAVDGGASRTDEPHFLQTDGWAEQVSFHHRASVAGATAPDLVVVCRAGSPATPLVAAAKNATVVMELDRGPVGRIRRARALRAAGFTPLAQYLVTPDLARAKRYVSLSSAEAIGWLLRQPPPLPGTRSGISRTAVGVGIRTISAAVAKLASIPMISVLAGAGAQGLMIATRGQPQHGTIDESTGDLPQVLMTSGHDEGSRAVLVSLGPDRSDQTVTKMSPRPRYNSNIETEGEVIRSVRSLIERSGSSGANSLLPVLKPPVVSGRLHGAQEIYAGRWTATDLCNRAPGSRRFVLTSVLEAIDELSLATLSQTVAWSSEVFDQYLGDLFDRYRTTIGWSPTLDAFRASLAERSDALVGHSIPLVQRHYDLGPWNVVFDDDAKGLTIIDWELAPPRTIGQAGLGGADQLYFCKYWLHIATGAESVDDELVAFEFVTGATQATAAKCLTESCGRLGINPRFVPLLAGYLWLEVALYTAARRADNGGDPGSSARYIDTLARRRTELLRFWG